MRGERGQIQDKSSGPVAGKSFSSSLRAKLRSSRKALPAPPEIVSYSIKEEQHFVDFAAVIPSRAVHPDGAW
jgi:hypothetical protein